MGFLGLLSPLKMSLVPPLVGCTQFCLGSLIGDFLISKLVLCSQSLNCVDNFDELFPKFLSFEVFGLLSDYFVFKFGSIEVEYFLVFTFDLDRFPSVPLVPGVPDIFSIFLVEYLEFIG